MVFAGQYYPWLHLWMLSAVPLVTFTLGAISWKVLGRWTFLLIALGIMLMIVIRMAGG